MQLKAGKLNETKEPFNWQNRSENGLQNYNPQKSGNSHLYGTQIKEIIKSGTLTTMSLQVFRLQNFNDNNVFQLRLYECLQNWEQFPKIHS